MTCRRSLFASLLSGIVCFFVVACGDDDRPEKAGLGESCGKNSECSEGLECTEGEEDSVCTYALGGDCQPELDNGGCSSEAVCAELTAGGNRCFHPVLLRGAVHDTSNAAGIEGAHIIAIDDEGVAVTDVAASEEEGSYLLEIPVLRDEDGTPEDSSVRLDAAAQDYQSFPSGIRVALPISTTEAFLEDGAYVIENALTQVGLISLESASRTVVSGSIGDSPEGDGAFAGVLVVVSGDAGAFSAITDRSGQYTVFNVPAGSFEVRGYAVGLQLDPQTVTVSEEPVTDVVLYERGDPTTTLSGNVQIVNAPGGSETSVILVVEDTFNASAATGEVPRGLRAPSSGPPDVTGDFTIEGVPDGRYVVLAAYENDYLVRDPDTNIAGTDFVFVEIDAASETAKVLNDSFKVTEALEVFGPGADGPDQVAEAPVLRWADDSSEDYYEVRVFDALGNEVWTALDVPGVSGSAEVSVPYEGPLEPGMYYQFRVTSWRQPGNGEAAPISATEDLRGVFYSPAE